MENHESRVPSPPCAADSKSVHPVVSAVKRTPSPSSPVKEQTTNPPALTSPTSTAPVNCPPTITDLHDLEEGKGKRESVISEGSAESGFSLGHTSSTSPGEFSPVANAEKTQSTDGGSEPSSKKTSVSSQRTEVSNGAGGTGTVTGGSGETSRGGEARFKRRFGTARSPSTTSSLLVNHVNESPDSEDGRSKTPSPFKIRLTNKHGTLAHRSRWTKLRTTVKMASVVTQTTKEKRKRKASGLQRQDSFMKKFSTRHGGALKDTEDESSGDDTPQKAQEPQKKRPLSQRLVIHPDENFMFYWLAMLTLAVLYNLWTCIARQGFPEIRIGYDIVWFTFDGVFDFIYLLDIFVQLRTGYLERGLIVYESKKLAKQYVFSRWFIIDVISLTPLDFLQVATGQIHPLLRFPRFLKIYRSYLFMYMVETRTMYPNLTRVANLSHLLFLGAHWFAAFYYMISESEGFRGAWAYPVPTGEFASVTRKYLKSLYWSTLTLTTIGDLPPPESNWQYLFTIVSYLIGVFVFATIVGQVGNVITNRNASRLEFERLLDGAKIYMRSHNVPAEMQRRVQRWYNYAWSRGRMNGGGDINSLGLLPDKLKTELALHVNLDTLKKVTIFQECEPEFLHDLMLKMRAFIFTPGDLICRKGEVAREMFIIADGLLEVISDSGEVLTQMGAGDFFGEIGILNLDGGVNRRTADVQSVGYSELFVLSREDVLAALKDHPEAEQILTEHGRKRLIGIRQKNLENEMGKIRKKYTAAQEEANPAPVTNLLGVRIKSSRKAKSPTNVIAAAPLTGEVSKPTSENVRISSASGGDSSQGLDMNEVLSTIKLALEDKLAKSEKAWEEKVASLVEDNAKKAEQIEELETRLRSLQRALVWKQGERAGPLPLPSIDV